MIRAAPDTRLRLVAATADMLGRYGLNATSVRELAKSASAPLGSTYHYFPGGKPQMVSEAVSMVGNRIAQLLQRELAAGVLPGLRAFFVLWRDKLEASQFAAGCPILAVAAENSDDDTQTLAAAGVFANWCTLISQALQEQGVALTQADGAAALIVAAVEGAIVMCRAERSSRPLEQVAQQLELWLQALLPGRIATPATGD